MEARLSILHTMGRYSNAGDRGRAEDYASCFAPDGTFEVVDEGVSATGRDAIMAFLEGEKASLAGKMTTRLIRHFWASPKIEVTSPTEATADSYFLAITEIGPDHWGRYRDRWRPVDGEWLIAHRKVTLDGATAGSWQEDIVKAAGK